MDLIVKLKSLKEGAKAPVYSTAEAAGADLHACISHPIMMEPGDRCIVPTGLSCELLKGWEMQVRSRSGLAIKSGVIVLNAPGTIDSDYRGEIGVILMNLGSEPFVIEHGDRIAQAVIAPAPQAKFVWTGGVLSSTDRGEGGYGSTGVAAK